MHVMVLSAGHRSKAGHARQITVLHFGFALAGDPRQTRRYLRHVHLEPASCLVHVQALELVDLELVPHVHALFSLVECQILLEAGYVHLVGVGKALE